MGISEYGSCVKTIHLKIPYNPNPVIYLVINLFMTV